MAEIAVNVAVLQDGKILLTQRDDMESWVLPGGGVEEGESLVQAAIRETSEETDLNVELTGIVGLYSRLGSFSPGHMVLFAARSVGGRLRRQEGETIAVDWFSPDDLPSPLGPGHRRRILDALAGKRGLAVSQHIRIPGMPGKWTRKDYIAVRDASGLQRQEFFKQLISGMELSEIVEIDPTGADGNGR